jgi:hypothetical protein
MDFVTVDGFDEANFMGTGLVDVASELADSGKQVIIAGRIRFHRPVFQPSVVGCGNPAKAKPKSE